MGGSSEKKEYAKTSYNTGGLFGSSTTSKSGTKFKPNDYMATAGNTAWGGLNNTLNSLGSNDYSNDPNFIAYQNQLNKNSMQNFDNSVLSQLANRGLMRSSGLQSATNAFGQTLADDTVNLYDNYYNRTLNNLGTYQTILNSLFNYITGINSGSQTLSNNVSNYNLNKQGSNSNIGSLIGQLGGIANAGASAYATKKGASK